MRENLRLEISFSNAASFATNSSMSLDLENRGKKRRVAHEILRFGLLRRCASICVTPSSTETRLVSIFHPIERLFVRIAHAGELSRSRRRALFCKGLSRRV